MKNEKKKIRHAPNRFNGRRPHILHNIISIIWYYCAHIYALGITITIFVISRCSYYNTRVWVLRAVRRRITTAPRARSGVNNCYYYYYLRFPISKYNNDDANVTEAAADRRTDGRRATLIIIIIIIIIIHCRRAHTRLCRAADDDTLSACCCSNPYGATSAPRTGAPSTYI